MTGAPARREMTAIEVKILGVLERGGEWGTRRLASELGHDLRYVSLGLIRLFEAGRIERVKHGTYRVPVRGQP